MEGSIGGTIFHPLGWVPYLTMSALVSGGASAIQIQEPVTRATVEARAREAKPPRLAAGTLVVQRAAALVAGCEDVGRDAGAAVDARMGIACRHGSSGRGGGAQHSRGGLAIRWRHDGGCCVVNGVCHTGSAAPVVLAYGLGLAGAARDIWGVSTVVLRHHHASISRPGKPTREVAVNRATHDFPLSPEPLILSALIPHGLQASAAPWL